MDTGAHSCKASFQGNETDSPYLRHASLELRREPVVDRKVMGHRDTDMIIRVYSKYVEDVFGSKNGTLVDSEFQRANGK